MITDLILSGVNMILNKIANCPPTFPQQGVNPNHNLYSMSYP